ncbi:MAG: plastocyanin/azurin family copper-binding protein [Candidatus Nitrosotenuis sp.]
MSNWDLMMPGMGLTAIGLAGVTISYAGIAHTFIDGMHALTGLTMFIGLIFLAAGILEGGVSTSNRAKATTLVVLGISFSFGLAALNFNAISTIPTFAGVMLIVVVPAIVMAYVAMKMPQYAKPVSIIFIIAVGAAIAAYVGFGLFGPSPYLVPPPVVEEEPQEPAPTAPIFAISILKGSAIQGNPDYDPDVAHVPLGNIIEWTNNDDVAHTVTSAADGGATFDSSLIGAGATYRLDTSTLQVGTYDYFCIVHPWMEASFEAIEESAERVAEEATVTEPNSLPETQESEGIVAEEIPVTEEPPVEESIVEEPVTEESMIERSSQESTQQSNTISIPLGSSTPGCETTDECFVPSSLTVPVGTSVTWTNDDTAAHTVTSGSDTTPDGNFDSGLFMAGKTFSHTFDVAGEYPYYCLVHPWMTGRVTVE